MKKNMRHKGLKEREINRKSQALSSKHREETCIQDLRHKGLLVLLRLEPRPPNDAEVGMYLPTGRLLKK